MGEMAKKALFLARPIWQEIWLVRVASVHGAVTLVIVDVLPCTQAIAQEIYADLVEDSCLGFCFEVHRAVKCGYFFLDDTDPDSMKDFGELQG